MVGCTSFLLIHELFNRLIIFVDLGRKEEKRKEMKIKKKKKIGKSLASVFDFLFYHRILQLGFGFALHAHFTSTFEFAPLI